MKKSRNAEKEKRILEAAKKVFYTKGYLKATMDDIAQEANMSKPLIYRSFKAKDDLFFFLMTPVFDESKRLLARLEKKLAQKKYQSGPELLRDMFQGLYRIYRIDPDAFKIVQLFQHTGMVWELNEETRALLIEQGRYNFRVARRLVAAAVDQGLLRDVDSRHLVDTIWGGFLGIVRLADTKTAGLGVNAILRPTLAFFENMVIDAMTCHDKSAKE